MKFIEIVRPDEIDGNLRLLSSKEILGEPLSSEEKKEKEQQGEQ